MAANKVRGKARGFMNQKTITALSVDLVSCVFGAFDANCRLIEQEYDVTISGRGDEIRISGENEFAVAKAFKVLESLLAGAKTGEPVSEHTVRYTITMVNDGEESLIQTLGEGVVCMTAKGKPIRAKTVGQQTYLNAIKDNTITIGIGPAGTGKTYLAVAMAVSAVKKKEVSRIILTRPAVEAGEKLGFLPGDLQNKVDPYLRPLHDALFDMLGIEAYQRYQERGVIEIAPLAYMRGRTLDDSFIILDEAQNTTREQMKMFLTRLGFGSKAVITGDVTQVDLPEGKKSGLSDAASVLKNIEDIAICRLGQKDVVRHKLVQEIIKAYEKAEAPKGGHGR